MQNSRDLLLNQNSRYKVTFNNIKILLLPLLTLRFYQVSECIEHIEWKLLKINFCRNSTKKSIIWFFWPNALVQNFSIKTWTIIMVYLFLRYLKSVPRLVGDDFWVIFYSYVWLDDLWFHGNCENVAPVCIGRKTKLQVF